MKKYCTKCGIEVFEKANFCGSCGNKLNNNNNQNSEKLSFTCEIIMDCHKSECHRFINDCEYFGMIDKSDLYEGYSNKEIKEYGIKAYKCTNHNFPCEIVANYDNEHYEIRYRENRKDYYFGYIPTEYNEKIYDIINNKEITFGGISFENGLYKEYDPIEDKIVEDYDEYKINLILNYK